MSKEYQREYVLDMLIQLRKLISKNRKYHKVSIFMDATIHSLREIEQTKQRSSERP